MYPIYIHPCPSLYTTGSAPPSLNRLNDPNTTQAVSASAPAVPTCDTRGCDLHRVSSCHFRVDPMTREWMRQCKCNGFFECVIIASCVMQQADWGCTGARHIQCSPAGWHAACLLNTSIEIITNVVVAKIVAIDIDIASSLDTCRAIVILLR